MSVQSQNSAILLRSPGAFAAALPALVGFHPVDSLVAVYLGGSQVIVTMRLDMPTAARDVASSVVSTGSRVGADEVILAVYQRADADSLPFAQEVREIVAVCEQANIRVRDALLIDDGRYWSYLCGDDACCPTEGTPVPEETSSVEAEQVIRGLPSVAVSRKEVVDRYRPRPNDAPGPEARADAEKALQLPLARRAQQCWEAVKTLATASTNRQQDGAEMLRARVQVAMSDVRVRDFVLAHVALSNGDTDALVDVVVQAALTAPEDLRPPVAAAASALLASCGPSSIAVSCLLDLAEGQSLAELVRAGQGMALPPGQLRALIGEALPSVVQQLRAASSRQESTTA